MDDCRAIKSLINSLYVPVTEMRVSPGNQLLKIVTDLLGMPVGFDLLGLANQASGIHGRLSEGQAVDRYV